jgi:GTP1/Obg family GTP-binding protein
MLFSGAQISLFQNIKALFANKPLMLVASKSDLKTLAQLPQEQRQVTPPPSPCLGIEMAVQSHMLGSFR